ncbi:family 78 glycoside hydrolase catalytic domain [Paenibacillus sp. GD4]|uniref:family 78 glycoside hydrolase catalytic domain n=1 Tax=Paenibacillus sp. GD4 TaxID=3068890 RepID=UPI0027969BE2|nr:family 78 glycoside hydrolase catalytic domain [Paenibacillus sp. GD4]MDQ1908997.1 family 78 glycoside hydrolase catalytic domain [Paenibacillus sp. GD4]
MNQFAPLHWNAQWIWGGEEESPRNEWRCFRRSFDAPDQGWSLGKVSITADSRYTLYINGEQVGRGPARCWPFEQSYDTYDIGHLIKPGRRNTLAVLVQHFGVSTFYYVRGRGGLLVQLDLTNDDKNVYSVTTDQAWRTIRHPGQDPRAPRMSCQHAFAERIDANGWDDRWIDTDYSDVDWPYATVLGSVGMEPWVTLKPRDIFPLTEETIYPSRVEGLSKVVPVPWTANLELRSQMIPGCDDDANAYVYAGYVATVIRTASAAKAVIGITYAPPLFGGIIVNGVRHSKASMRGEKNERYLDTELREGDNLLLVELSGNDHGRGLFMGIDCNAPFELAAPFPAGEEASPFLSIGPFESYEYIDHQFDEQARAKHRIINACKDDKAELSGLEPSDLEKITAFRKVGRAAAAADLTEFEPWVRTVPRRFVSPESILSLSIMKKQSEPLPVPKSLQHVVTANSIPGIVPIFEQADTEIIIDFGCQTVGYITFEVEADEGTILDFYGYEHMRDGWIQHMNYLENSIRYICRQGRQRYTSYIRRGFRYLAVTVRGAAKPVKLYGVQLRQSHYPVAEIGQFQCSDSLLNDIWEISRTTARLCMEDTFVDCPAYEQTFWVGDSRNEALIAYYLFGSEEMVKHCLELVPGSRGQTPLYVDQVPSGWNSVIPNWTFFWVNACREYYSRTGDQKFAESIWPHVAYTLDHYLKLIDDRGLLFMDGWNFLDWAPIDQPREGAVTHQNMFFVRALLNAAELAEIAGVKGESDKYRASAEALCRAINQHLWSEERQAYLDCIHADGRPSDIFSMQTQVVAYLCDIGAGMRKERMESLLISPPSNFVPIGSPFMSFFYYEALAKMGRHRQMIDDIRHQYGQMIEYGATTCWEMYPKLKDGRILPKELTRSHCHAWSAAPGYFLGAYVLGIRETGPGWSRVTVMPEPCGLSWARGSVPLPNEGRIDVSWQLDESEMFHLQVRLPEGIDADVRLPDGYEGTIDIQRIG